MLQLIAGLLLTLSLGLGFAYFVIQKRRKKARQNARELLEERVLKYARFWRHNLDRYCSPGLNKEIGIGVRVLPDSEYGREWSEVVVTIFYNGASLTRRQVAGEFQSAFEKFVARPKNRKVKIRLEMKEDVHGRTFEAARRTRRQ